MLNVLFKIAAVLYCIAIIAGIVYVIFVLALLLKNRLGKHDDQDKDE